MEGIFISVLCLSGCFTFSTCLLHQYHFVSDAKTWTEAQSYCREKYTDLATIENTEEMKKLKDTVSAAGNSSEVWIGLYSHIDWKWSDGFNQSGAEYRKWHWSDPNNNKANQLCVVQTSYATWYDIECHEKSPFVCYNETLEDSDFVLVNTAKNWTEAQRHCREHFTDLATVTNHDDFSKIHSMIIPIPWASIAAVKTLVKMSVKLEDSSLDLNDPGLQDRLKENGLSGVTLKWKEQADGKVFHKEEKSSDKKKKTEL
ncbi:unnamed protein product [Pleuronectes platessa]|uniref:C-type lectin domain-containing protein n=1 Tax=Pleuronectes platessa TaxID=8262 RepID=A0A9N7U274_PLEPL|nr:unnamed protein product [Pleuronectes platessa]